MKGERERLGQVVRGFAPPTDAYERLVVRRGRRQRNRRMRAGVLGVVVALATGMLLARSLTSTGTPADRPAEPVPATSGSLAYALDGDIYVADPEASSAVKITDKRSDGCEGMGEYSIPSWSPDGRYLAFQHDCPTPEQRNVVIADPQGDVVAEFPGDGWGFTWSPDSTRISVWETYLRTIGIYGIDGERQASLPMPPLTGGGNDSAPGWMPDGSALLLHGHLVVPLDGSDGYDLSLGGQATYSPDGARVAVDTGNSIAVLDTDGALVAEVPGLNGVDAWSPDGNRFASLLLSQLNVVEIPSGTVRVLSEAKAALHSGTILAVQGFSPDGDRILYAAGDSSGHTVALWSIGVDGSDPRLLVPGTAQGEWLSR
jgi:Tol biopolymer transport system component